jgi:hypothetical protein
LITIKLTHEGLHKAAAVGVRRRIESLGKYRDSYERSNRNYWEIDIQGAIAEMAAAHYLQLPWTGVEAHADDLPGIDVKSTNNSAKGLRIIDGKDLIFVLAYVRQNEVTLKGWARLEDAYRARVKWELDNKGRRFCELPITELHPIADLRDWIANGGRHD